MSLANKLIVENNLQSGHTPMFLEMFESWN